MTSSADTGQVPSPEVSPAPVVYEGQFGSFTIDPHDRREVVRYRIGLAIAALCFVLGTAAVLWQGDSPWALQGLTILYGLFWLALGLSLFNIHIYLKPLHRLLQGLWLVGGVASGAIAALSPDPLALTVYEHPIYLWGVGFTFAALTGIFFKEAFCFNRFETKLLTPLVPFLLLGHLFQFLPSSWESILLAFWALNFIIFVLRKAIQPIPPDIGDKSVFTYLAQQADGVK